MPLYERLRPVLRLWYARELAFGELTAKPVDSPSIRSGRPDAGRVLLLGNGSACGWGTLTYQLALPGQLARSLQRRSGRPWDVEYVGDEPMNMASALPWLGTAALHGYDAVVISVGANDAVRLTSVREWESHLGALLEHLAARIGPDRPVLITGIPAPSRSSHFATLFPGVIDHHARVLNGATRRMVADFRTVHYVDLAPPEGDEPECAIVYQELAEQITEHLRIELDRTRQPAMAEHTTDPTEWDEGVAARVVERIRRGGSPELQRITDEAKRVLKVDMATISLLEGDRLHYAINSDRLPLSIPRSLSYCRYVAADDAPLVVPNRAHDERFRDNPLLDLAHIPFYAGFPLHAGDGSAVGSLCLLNGRSKSARSVHPETLARLGRDAQAELLVIEAAVRAEQVADRAAALDPERYDLTS